MPVEYSATEHHMDAADRHHEVPEKAADWIRAMPVGGMMTRRSMPSPRVTRIRSAEMVGLPANAGFVEETSST